MYALALRSQTKCKYFKHFGKSWKLKRLSTGAGGRFHNRLKVAVVTAWLVLQVSSLKSTRLSRNTVVLLNFLNFVWSLNIVKCRNGYLFLERKIISQKSIISLFSPG